MRKQIYQVRERGTYRQFFIPKQQPGTQEKIDRAQRSFIHLPVTYSALPLLVMPQEFRTSFLIQNLSASRDLFIGIGVVPDFTNELGLRIGPGQSYEPLYVPQNEIYVVSDGAGTATIIYSVD